MLRTSKYEAVKKFHINTYPKYNRRHFNNFIDDIINICILVPELKTVFATYPESAPYTSNTINDSALFVLILSRTEGYERDLVKPFTAR